MAALLRIVNGVRHKELGRQLVLSDKTDSTAQAGTSEKVLYCLILIVTFPFSSCDIYL